MLSLLQTGRQLGVSELMSELNVSRRTLFRDLDVLSRAGIPCFFDDEKRSYAIEQSLVLPPSQFTLSEALALMLASRHFLSRRVVPDYGAASRAALKLESLLPAPLLARCESLLGSVAMRWPPITDADAVRSAFDLLQRAIVARTKINVRYESYFEKDEITTVLRPYRIVFITRAWYVIGYSEAHGEVRTFKLDRMTRIESTGEGFEPDPKFDLDAYFGNAWQMIRGERAYHVRIRFSPKVAGNVEEVLWHPTQQTNRLDDGSLLYEVDVDGVHEISWWVLGYGREAVVDEPAELRAIIREHAEAMLRQYAS